MSMAIEDLPNHGSSNPRLWLIRHGETEWSKSGRHTGVTDVPLTSDGKRQAADLAPRLADIDFGLVLTSPLRRARQTAELAGLDDALVEPAAAEWNYGNYEGLTTPEIHRTSPEWSVWSDGAPGGESVPDVAARADAVIDRVLGSGADSSVLIAHSHFLRLLTARWLELPAEAGHHFLLGTGKVCILGWDRRTPALLGWNV